MSSSDVSLSVPSHEDYESLSLSINQDIRLVPATSLAITPPTILTLSPSMVDNSAVDNHGLLLRYWQAIPLARKWIVFLGAALGLSLTARMLTSPSAVPFVPFAISSQHAIDRTQTTFNKLYQNLRESLGDRAVDNPNDPGVTVPVSAIQPSLKPMMVDRFYLVENAQMAAQDDNPQPTVVVDRYYFYPHTSSSSNLSANNHQVPAVLGSTSPLRVPIPPTAQFSSSAQPPSPPSSRTQLSSTQPMLPPLAAPQSPTALVQHPPLGPTSASVQSPKRNRLIGIIQAGQLTAALVQTEDNSYVVKLGDRLSQSSLQVIDIQPDFVVFGNNAEQRTIRVGDAF